MSDSQPASSAQSRASRMFRPWLENPSLGTLRQEMNNLFEQFVNEPLAGLRNDGGPRVDVSETEEVVEITTEVPGYHAEEIRVELGENDLIISGQRSQEQQAETSERKYHRHERRQGSFSRTLWLPCAIDDSRAEAHLAAGLLTIRLPKSAAAKRKTIPVSSGAAPVSERPEGL